MKSCSPVERYRRFTRPDNQELQSAILGGCDQKLKELLSDTVAAVLRIDKRISDVAPCSLRGTGSRNFLNAL